MKKVAFLSIIFLLILGLSGCGKTDDGGETSLVPKTGSFWKSIDGGKTWAVVYDKKTDITEIDVLNVVFNQFDSNNLLVGLKGKGILRTENGGESWEYLKFSAEKVYGLAIDPVDSRKIYASGVLEKRGKIFKSLDGGENWEEIYTTPANGPLVVSLVIDPKNSNIIYAATTEEQLLKSADGGNSWKNIFDKSDPIVRVVIDKKTGLIFMLDKGGKLYRSLDGGMKIEDISKKISDSFFSRTDLDVLELDQLTGWVYVAGEDGILRSKNRGENWEKIQGLSKSEDYPVRSLAINPKNSNELFYGAGQTVYKSVDGGNTWSTSQFNVAKGIREIKHDPQNSNIVYIGMSKLDSR